MGDSASIRIGDMGEAEESGGKSNVQQATEQLAQQIQRWTSPPDAAKLLKQVFCRVLGWTETNQPIPLDALPQAAREEVAEAVTVARHGELRLCYVRLATTDLLAKDQQTPMDRLADAWPTVLVAFSNFARDQIAFCHKSADGRQNRFRINPGLLGALELPQWIDSLGAFELKSEEPAPRRGTLARLERKLARRGRRVPRGRELGLLGREMQRHEPLTIEEDLVLYRQIEPGKPSAARDKLILANLRLVVAMAAAHRHPGISFDDRLQEGVLGLMRAVETFDPQRGFRFWTYAGWWVMAAINRGVIERSRLVRLPDFWIGRIQSYRRFCKQFAQDHGFEPTDEELLENLELSGAGRHPTDREKGDRDPQTPPTR